MRTIKRKSKAPAYKVGDRVVTAQGEGRVAGVFPSGPHRKATYAVKFAGRRVAVILDENQVSAIKPAPPRGRESA